MFVLIHMFDFAWFNSARYRHDLLIQSLILSMRYLVLEDEIKKSFGIPLDQYYKVDLNSLSAVGFTFYFFNVPWSCDGALLFQCINDYSYGQVEQ